MTGKTEKIKKLKKLVDKFHSQEKIYKSKNYDETSTRQEFIDEFFQILGWDIGNKQGLPEATKEVELEDSLEVEKDKDSTQGRADYCFKIGGYRKFFVEAKKPSVNIEQGKNPALQTRRYGYSARLPLCILTDFEELAVYDTRVQPKKTDSASTSRYKYWKYTQYEQAFEEISNIFSREAVDNGSLEKWKADNKSPKGSLPVDKAFLALIENWREALAKEVAAKNKKIDIYELNYIVQKIIDRIIFLRIAEARQIEDYRTLIRANKEISYYQHLQKISNNAYRKYNGGLFQPEDIFKNLTISDKVLKNIIENLYFPESPYEFSIFSAEILGSIYEQFLGNTIRLTNAHQAKIDQKPDVKKAGGVYYTPQYIVDYIVKNTIGKMIAGKTPEQIAELKFLDPACGSGSFLIGVYRYLLAYHLNYYQSKQRKTALEKAIIYKKSGNSYALKISEKQRILTNNIHGVDIDRQAVEVAKLSLLLKLLEGENNESVNSLFKHSQLKALPDLSSNIKCGNSLVASDFYNNKPVTLLDDEKQVRKINVFDWEDEQSGFGKILARGGFDVVLGNPPYIQLQKFKGEILQEAMQEARFETHHARGDIYALFYEKGCQLLKKNGLFGYITSNKWLRAGYGEPLKTFLLKNTALQFFIDFSQLKVFKDATVDTHIVIFKKKAVPAQKTIGCFVEGTPSTAADLTSQIKTKPITLAKDKDLFLMLDQQDIALKNKVENTGKPLGEWDIKINFCIKTGYNNAFIIDEQKRTEILENCPDDQERQRTDELIKPILRGKDINRYQTQWAGIYLIFIPWHFPLHKDSSITGSSKKAEKIFQMQYSALYNHFLKYKTQLSKRNTAETGIRYEWYALQRCANTYYEEFEKEKILFSRIVRSPQFYYDKNSYYGEATTYVMSGNSLKYLLGFLNSNFVYNIFHKFYSGGGIDGEIKIAKLINLPIPPITEKNQKLAAQLENNVDNRILTQEKYNKANIQNDKNLYQNLIKNLDKQIDNLVYQLYELTPAEIQIISNKP
jgi:hypothetical protein